MKKGRKEKKNIPGWQRHNAHCRQVSRAGHPSTLENAHQSQQLPGLCSTVTKRSSISWQSPFQICLAECSQDSQVSLITRRFHYPVPDTLDSAVFAQGSVKKYFTRRITLNWIWFESFPSKTSCKGILKLTLKLKDNIKKDYLYWQKGPNFWSMTPCLVAGEPWPVKAFKLAHTELKTVLLHRKSFFLVAVLIPVHECFALSCLNSTLFLIQFIFLSLSRSSKLQNLKICELCSWDKPACDHCPTQTSQANLHLLLHALLLFITIHLCSFSTFSSNSVWNAPLESK